MKKSKLFILLFLFQPNAFSQSPLREGIAIFEFNYPDAEVLSPEALANRPKGLKIYFKEGKSRVEYDNESRWVNIVDPDKKEILSMGTADHKTGTIMTLNEKVKNQAAEFGTYDVKITGETKDIAGFKCKKAIVTYSGLITSYQNRMMGVWFTNQIAATNTQYFLKGIAGFIMEYTHVTTPDLDLVFREVLVCTKVEEVKVSDSMFKLPADCKVETWGEVNKNLKVEFQDH